MVQFHLTCKTKPLTGAVQPAANGTVWPRPAPPSLGLHILLLLLELPELWLDGNGSLLRLRGLHVDVKVLGWDFLLLVWKEREAVRNRGDTIGITYRPPPGDKVPGSTLPPPTTTPIRQQFYWCICLVFLTVSMTGWGLIKPLSPRMWETSSGFDLG